MYVFGWETRFYGLSQCLSIGALVLRNDPMTRMSWGEFKMAPAKRVKRCDMSMSKFTTIDAFFVNVNKSSVPAIVPEQSESASFVTLVEIHNVDVPATSNRDATVLPPLALFAVAKRDRGRLQH